MGLDMYLSKKNNIGEEIEVGYWRKANQIHRWFVENVQGGEDDCGEYVVKKEDLEALLELCMEVKTHSKLVAGKAHNGDILLAGRKWEPNYEDGKVIENSDTAKKLLPTQAGFFFGSTDYDEYYVYDIEDTIDILNRALRETDFENEQIIYSSSW